MCHHHLTVSVARTSCRHHHPHFYRFLRHQVTVVDHTCSLSSSSRHRGIVAPDHAHHTIGVVVSLSALTHSSSPSLLSTPPPPFLHVITKYPYVLAVIVIVIVTSWYPATLITPLSSCVVVFSPSALLACPHHHHHCPHLQHFFVSSPSVRACSLSSS